MDKSNILSICTSGHGVGGAICLDGKIVSATTLERLTRKKYDILLPISKTDLETFGWKGDPEHYKKNVGLPFDLENDYSEVDFNELSDFQLFIDYLLDAAGIQSARIYISGTNLITLTNYKGFDPEVGSNGIDISTYPLTRTFSVGVNLSF